MIKIEKDSFLYKYLKAIFVALVFVVVVDVSLYYSTFNDRISSTVKLKIEREKELVNFLQKVQDKNALHLFSMGCKASIYSLTKPNRNIISINKYTLIYKIDEARQYMYLLDELEKKHDTLLFDYICENNRKPNLFSLMSNKEKKDFNKKMLGINKAKLNSEIVFPVRFKYLNMFLESMSSFFQ